MNPGSPITSFYRLVSEPPVFIPFLKLEAFFVNHPQPPKKTDKSPQAPQSLIIWSILGIGFFFENVMARRCWEFSKGERVKKKPSKIDLRDPIIQRQRMSGWGVQSPKRNAGRDLGSVTILRR